MPKLYLDLETYCEVPINHGTHAYAEKAEIMLFAWAIDDGPVSVYDMTDPDTMEDGWPIALYEALEDPAVLIYAHNSQFDRTVMRHALPEFDLPITRWRDTMVKALAHGLPGALGALCDVLKIDTDKSKDKEGRQLIHLFCKPRPASSTVRRATRETHPEQWAKFVTYAGLDIEAMREVDKVLPEWNYKGNELALWHLDQQINDRGFQVDMELVGGAIRAVEREQKRLAEKANHMTGGAVRSATQRDALLAHLLAEYGVELPDMQKSTLERRINDPDLPEPLRELLAIRLQASTTSTSKYKTLAKGVSTDGRLRGTLQFCGASRTGRWAGRLFQPQNISRGTVHDDELALGIEAIKANCEDLICD